jgi:hypothetical protein
MITHDANIESGWKGLCNVGGVAALVAVIFFRRNFGAELISLKGFGLFDVPAVHPRSALEWFTLLQENTIIGLALLNIVDLINYALVGLIFLALYGVLEGVNKSATVIATTCGMG